jgi:hypothetical protein
VVFAQAKAGRKWGKAAMNSRTPKPRLSPRLAAKFAAHDRAAVLTGQLLGSIEYKAFGNPL